jgi:signal transduction histidine kinase
MSERNRDGREPLLPPRTKDAVRRLAGGLAHEFNIVAVILSQTERLLQNKRLDGNDYSAAASIHQGARRVVELTRQLLAYSGSLSASPAAVDLNTRLPPLANELRNLLMSGTILETALDTGSFVVWIDPAHLDLVFRSIVLFMRERTSRGGRILISTRPVDMAAPPDPDDRCFKAGRYMMVTFRDEGPELNEEMRRRLFEPFSQPGGLALAAARACIHQAGGGITWTASPVKGFVSMFICRRPMPHRSCRQTSLPSPPTIQGRKPFCSSRIWTRFAR